MQDKRLKNEPEHVTLLESQMTTQGAFKIGDFDISLTWNEDARLMSLDLEVVGSLSSSPGLTVKNPASSPLVESALPKPIRGLVTQIRNYFTDGVPIEIRDWDLFDWSEVSDFQKEVYQLISQVPHGETRTYNWAAQRMGRPMACRAVGQALRRNRFPVIIPCHRIVSSQGLGGFMGKTSLESPELSMKTKLIEIEHIYRNPLFPFLVNAVAS